jgi:hypothetical protein
LLKSLGLLPIAALCLMTLTPNHGLAQSLTAKPVGTWERQTKDGHFLLTIKEDRLQIRFEKSNEAMTTVDADYSISRDGILFGVVIFAEKDLGSEQEREVKSDLPFCCRYRVDGDELTIRDGKISEGDLDKLAGRYRRVEEKVSSTKATCTTTMCELKSGGCAGIAYKGAGQECCTASSEPRYTDLVATWCAEAKPAVNGASIAMSTPVNCVKRVSCNNPPEDAQILRAMDSTRSVPYLYEKNRDDIQIVKELIVDRVDDARFYPLIGPARLHHAHYKCTVYYNETISSSFPFPVVVKRPRIDVVYIDTDRLDPVTPTR